MNTFKPFCNNNNINFFQICAIRAVWICPRSTFQEMKSIISFNYIFRLNSRRKMYNWNVLMKLQAPHNMYIQSQDMEGDYVVQDICYSYWCREMKQFHLKINWFQLTFAYMNHIKILEERTKSNHPKFSIQMREQHKVDFDAIQESP